MADDDIERYKIKLTDKRFVLLLFTVSFSVQVDVDVVDDGQVIELEMLAPEAQVVLLLASGSGVHVSVQAQLTEIPI